MTKKGLTQLILSALLISAFGPITYVAKSADTSTATTSTPTPTPPPTPTATSTPRTETTTATTTETTTATTSTAPTAVTNSIDVALAIEALIPGAQYGGSTTANTKKSFDDLRWEDQRAKPTWEALLSAWNNLVATRSSTKGINSTTDTRTFTTQTKPTITTQSETRTAQIAEVALISNTKERTVATVELIKTYSSAEKEQVLDVTYKSKNSTVIDVDLAVPGIPVVITATKKGSPTITLKSTTDADGEAQIKTTKNLEGYSVALTVNKTKIDTDVVKKKK